jgi:hypothetical protein
MRRQEAPRAPGATLSLQIHHEQQLQSGERAREHQGEALCRGRAPPHAPGVVLSLHIIRAMVCPNDRQARRRENPASPPWQQSPSSTRPDTTAERSSGSHHVHAVEPTRRRET